MLMSGLASRLISTSLVTNETCIIETMQLLRETLVVVCLFASLICAHLLLLEGWPEFDYLARINTQISDAPVDLPTSGLNDEQDHYGEVISYEYKSGSRDGRTERPDVFIRYGNSRVGHVRAL